MSEASRLSSAVERGDPMAAEQQLPLVYGDDPGRPWHGRAHFFAAAAEAMRRILVDRARHRETQKAGGGLRRVDIDAVPQDQQIIRTTAINRSRMYCCK